MPTDLCSIKKLYSENIENLVLEVIGIGPFRFFVSLPWNKFSRTFPVFLRIKGIYHCLGISPLSNICE